MIKKLSQIFLISLILVGGIKISLGAELSQTINSSTQSLENLGNKVQGLGTNITAISELGSITVNALSTGNNDLSVDFIQTTTSTGGTQVDFIPYTDSACTTIETYALTSTATFPVYNYFYYKEGGVCKDKSIDPITIDTSKYYHLFFTRRGGANGIKINGSSSNVYANGACGDDLSYSTTARCTPVVDAYFVVSDESFAGEPTIIITEPTDSQTYTTTFIQENGLTVQGTCGNVSTVTVDMYSVSKGWLIDKKSTTCTDNAFLVLLDVAEVWNDDYQINAYNFIGPGSTNDQIEITVNITSNPRVIPESALPDIEDTGSSFYVDCSSYDSDNFFTAITGGGFFCYLKKTLFAFGAFLLEPADSVTVQFEGSIQNIKNDFPFSVFFDITTILENEIETAPTGATLSITFPEPLDHTFNILTPTLMEDVVGEDLKNDVFNAVEILTWSLVGFAILATVF